MDERVRHKLAEIIGRYGRDICDQPKRCKGLLLDHCAGDRREVFVLVSALEEQVVGDLVSGLGSQSWGLVSSRLVRRLVERRAMAEDAALWAVESWALALGVITEAERIAGRPARQRHRKKPPPRTTVRTDSGSRPPSFSGPLDADAPDDITTRVGEIRLKRIPAGEFWMGSPDNDPEASDDEKPRHQVGISQAFYLGVTPVTQAQYHAVMGRNPSHFKERSDHPVESVTWLDSVRFCNKLSWKEALTPYYLLRGSRRVQISGGAGYRLPTESEWEYACRAGSEKRYGFGDDRGRLGDYAFYSPNSGGGTCSVRQKIPNAFGLCDMHGDVWEWCWDGYDRFYYRQAPGVDPLGLEEASCRVARGGCWNDKAPEVRAASRYQFSPEARYNFLGFRLARGISEH